jgi:predicted Zn-dependent protease
LETEADNNGLQLMAKSGIDQGGMLRLMELLQKQTIGKETPFLSTHPVFKKRIENIRNQIRGPVKNNPDEELKKLFHEIYE